MASLLDNFGQLIDQGYATRVAERLGENPQNIHRGLSAGATSILAGLANKTGDSGMMRQVFDLISSPSEAIREIDPAAYAEQAQTGTGVGSLSNRFLSDLFGDRSASVNDVVARSSGLSSTSVGSIMRFAAPLVLGFLGRHVKALGLDQTSFTRMLSDERGNIMRAAPAGLASALGLDVHEREVPIEGARTTPEYVTQREAVPVKRGGSRWLWPTVAALVVIALFWGARSRSHRAGTIDTSTAAGTVAPSTTYPETAVTPGAPIVPGAPSAMPTSGPITLPNGTVLNAAPGSSESRIFMFFSDTTQRAGANARFDADRVAFVTKSATLTPESDDQLNNIVSIMKAYPHAVIKITGFSNDETSPAQNKALADKRAAAVKAILLKKGIAARRVSSQGMGNQPMTDTSMGAAPAQNQPISILIIHK
jgi:outer membrane protein OmpA-like peptidoglycan-associated protein